MSLTVLRDKTGPDADAKRSAMRRLGADLDVVPDEAQPRLITFARLRHNETAMHVILPPRPKPWWAFWRKPPAPRAIFVIGRGTEWYHVYTKRDEIEDSMWYYRKERVGPQLAAVLATLWVNRENLVEDPDARG